MLVRTLPLSSFIAAPNSWIYRGDNYSDAGGLADGSVQQVLVPQVYARLKDGDLSG